MVWHDLKGIMSEDTAVESSLDGLPEEMIDPMNGEIIDQKKLAEQLLAQAKEQNIDLVGPGGLLNGLTKNVLETALDAEMSEHLGYEKHEVLGRDGANSRNGTRTKTVLTSDRSGRDRSAPGPGCFV